MTTARASWRPLMVKGAWNPDLRAKLRQASGAYVIRRADDRVIEYVGESHTGRMWKTLQRHFQRGSGAFEDRSEYVRTSPAPFEVAVWVTSKGGREKRKGDQSALDTQAALIERYKPTDNRDDGKAYGPCPHGCTSWRCARAHLVPEQGRGEEAPADDDFPFGANREEERGAFDDLLENPPRGPAALPPNVPIERRAEMRTPSLFTGRTRLEDEGAKVRRDWKGEAERLGRELAACRAAPPPPPIEKTATPAPRTLPVGYGETDEKGQATMFRRNPSAFGRLGLEATESMGMPLAFLPPRGVRLSRRPGAPRPGEWILRDDRGRVWLEIDDGKAAAWIAKAIERAHVATREMRYPGPTATGAEWATWWRMVAERLPPLPAKLRGPWEAHGTTGEVFDAEEHTVASPRDPALRQEWRGIGATVAALGTLATFGNMWSVKAHRTAQEYVAWEQRAMKAQERLPVNSARRRKLAAEESVLQILMEEAEGEAREAKVKPAPSPPPALSAEPPSPSAAPPSMVKLRGVQHLLALVDAGRGHSLEIARAPFPPWDPVVAEALRLGWIERKEARGSWPDRWVVTNAGIHALGTFASDEPRFRDQAIEAGEKARAKKRAAASTQPEGYGTETERGQLKLFNPSKCAGVGLVALGRLEAIVVRQKNAERTLYFRGAVLAYDAAGRLVIVHGPKPFGAATREEAREYRRTHWGAREKGKALRGRILEGRAGVRSLGSVTEITYITKKGRAAEAVYFHHFGRPGEGPAKTPRLPVLEAGEVGGVTLYRLRGGTYTVEARGIVG